MSLSAVNDNNEFTLETYRKISPPVIFELED